jgi:FkbM family methyltransferase
VEDSAKVISVYDAPQPRAFTSLLYNLLVHTSWIDRDRVPLNLWQRCWRKSCSLFSGPVSTTIHGRPVVVNYGHTYPIYSRKFRSLNNPLIELVYQCHAAARAPIVLVDVGANIGDTILLLEANCPDMLRAFYCIEGDADFFRYLQRNLGDRPNGHLIEAMLSAAEGSERQLLHTHAGTASAQGGGQVSALPLDAVLGPRAVERIDILKTDVDGVDGKVLLGARQLLEQHRPAVIFEWHPILCRNTGNSWHDHFVALGDCGYSTFVWFTKYGEWSHFMRYEQRGDIDMLAEFCLHSRTHYDWHYDVVALHEQSPLVAAALAELGSVKARRSAY